MNNTIIAAKYSQIALSFDIPIYFDSGFNYFLKHTKINIFNIILLIVNEPPVANIPDKNEFLGKSPTNVQ